MFRTYEKSAWANLIGDTVFVGPHAVVNDGPSVTIGPVGSAPVADTSSVEQRLRAALDGFALSVDLALATSPQASKALLRDLGVGSFGELSKIARAVHIVEFSDRIQFYPMARRYPRPGWLVAPGEPIVIGKGDSLAEGLRRALEIAT
jgi:hypothetical protein